MDEKNMEIFNYKNKIVNTINRLMYNKNWTVKALADHSELPYESVKKIVSGKINNPSVYSLLKISRALGCGIDYLIDNDNIINSDSLNLPSRAFSLVNEIVKFESYLANHNKAQKTNYISVLVPTGRTSDGMIFDSVSTDCVDISSIDSSLQKKIICGIKVVGDSFHPTYYNNDVLLITKDRFPLSNEVGIFVFGNKAYLRTYISGNPATLLPINGKGENIVIENIGDWLFWGRVITVIRS